MRRLVTMITLAAGVTCGAAAEGARGPAPLPKVTTPATARLVQFCDSEAGDYHDGFCTGYLLGYAYGLDGRPGTGVCIPDNIKVRRIRDLVIRFLRKNPRAVQADASIAVVAALRAGFPCPR